MLEQKRQLRNIYDTKFLTFYRKKFLTFYRKKKRS